MKDYNPVGERLPHTGWTAQWKWIEWWGSPVLWPVQYDVEFPRIPRMVAE